MEMTQDISAARDKQLAESIRNGLRDLRMRIEEAQDSGLTVMVHHLTHLYLQHGTASGAPSDLQIQRDH